MHHAVPEQSAPSVLDGEAHGSGKNHGDSHFVVPEQPAHPVLDGGAHGSGKIMATRITRSQSSQHHPSMTEWRKAAEKAQETKNLGD